MQNGIRRDFQLKLNGRRQPAGATIYRGKQKLTPAHANVMESYLWGPSEIGSHPLGKSYYGCHQMIGDVWEWTSSEYVLYPGFESRFPEYTDKWAINQKVLRGGCFATPSKQIRNSYRNYFRPQERIHFSGFRCAKDLWQGWLFLVNYCLQCSSHYRLIWTIIKY